MRTSLTATNTHNREGSGLTLLLVILLAASAQAVLAVESLIEQQTHMQYHSVGQEASRVATDFYLALNTAYSRGAVDSLNSILAADFVDHPVSQEPAQSRMQLIEFVRLVHSDAPDTRVRLVSLDGDRELVHATFIVESSEHGERTWTQSETLLIRDGRVRERWRAPFPRPVGSPIAHADWRRIDWSEGALALLEISGEPGKPESTIEIDGPALVWLRTGELFDASEALSSSGPISPATPLVVEKGMRIDLGRNRGSVHGWIVLARPVNSPPGRYEHAESAINGGNRLERMINRASPGDTWTAASFQLRLLARTTFRNATDRVTITVDRWVLPPGANVPETSLGKAGIVAVHRGSIVETQTGRTIDVASAVVVAAGRLDDWQVPRTGTATIERVVVT